MLLSSQTNFANPNRFRKANDSIGTAMTILPRAYQLRSDGNLKVKRKGFREFGGLVTCVKAIGLLFVMHVCKHGRGLVIGSSACPALVRNRWNRNERAGNSSSS